MMKIDTISKKVCSTFPIVLQRIFTPIGRTAAAARLILSNDQHHRHPSCSQSHGQRGKVLSQAWAEEGINFSISSTQPLNITYSRSLTIDI